MEREETSDSIHHALKVLREIAYVNPEGEFLPMDLCPNPLFLPKKEQTIDQLEIQLPSLCEAIKLAQINSQKPSLTTLLEVDLGNPEWTKIHEQLLAQHQVPLFVRFDGASLSNQNHESSIFQAVEFQFRIGGLGFHTAVDKEILGHSNLPRQYAKTLRETCQETWRENTTRVVLMVPPEKRNEVTFWAGKLKSNGVEASVISLTDDIQWLDELLDSAQKGARIIVRRELHLPMLLATGEKGKSFIQMALEERIRFEPPLPLFFDGKALSIILSQLGTVDKKLSDLSAATTPVFDEELAKKLIDAKREF